MKKLLKNVRASLADAKKHKNEPQRIPLKKWLAAQPGSTRRGVARGTFTLPSYVIG
jgi:hypothetical protein